MCHALSTYFATLPEQYPTVLFIQSDVAANSNDLQESYFVSVLPSCVLVKNGDVMARHAGEDYDALKSKIRTHM